MTGRSFYDPTLPADQALRLALSHMATASGRDHRQIAADLDLSPSQFSRAITTTPSDESHQRANFPADKIAAYTVASKCHSYWLTLSDYLGIDSERAAKCIRETKTPAQLEAERNQKIEEGITILREALRLTAQEPGGKARRRS